MLHVAEQSRQVERTRKGPTPEKLVLVVVLSGGGALGLHQQLPH